MKKTILLVVLLTLVAFVSGAIAAAPREGGETTPAPSALASTKPAPPAKLKNFSGEIKSADGPAKSIVVAGEKVGKTFVVDEQAMTTKGNESLTSTDLKTWMGVVVEYKQEKDRMIAMVIKVSAPKAEPKAKGSKK